MREGSYRFFDITGKHMSINYCDVGIKVYYNDHDIDFKFTYDYYDNNDQSGCPFNQIDKKYINHKNGLFITRNSLTELLTDYLLMDYNELSKLTGNITPMAYKIIVLKTICELW
jgi:hypothetical protein